MSRQIDRTELPNGYVVSTIRRDRRNKKIDELIVGLEKKYGVTPLQMGRLAELDMDGDYETMVFECDQDGEITNWQEQAFARYKTKKEARTGHREIVENWQRKNPA